MAHRVVGFMLVCWAGRLPEVPAWVCRWNFHRAYCPYFLANVLTLRLNNKFSYMKYRPTPIKGVFLIEPERFGYSRGYFME
ncbi:MAG: hypothetical protein K2O33_05765, partial [Muribaculaceae bacterium]|nr:hypothetical protein [Muribaculaceae bacterium]